MIVEEYFLVVESEFSSCSCYVGIFKLLNLFQVPGFTKMEWYSVEHFIMREVFVVHCMCKFNSEFVLVINDTCIWSSQVRNCWTRNTIPCTGRKVCFFVRDGRYCSSIPTTAGIIIFSFFPFFFFGFDLKCLWMIIAQY